MIKKSSNGVHPLMKKPEIEADHILLSTGTLMQEETSIAEPELTRFDDEFSGVWPVEPNILVEKARYENNFLYVTITNLYVESIKIMSMGVKYTSNNDESIDFKDTVILIPPGESNIQIPCPRGNPYKFVIRTANKTGTGSNRDNMTW